jgi:transmembrane sensor
MSHTPSDIDARIAAYLSGNCTEEERSWMQRWAMEAEENRHLFQEAERAWMETEQARQLPDTYNVDTAWERVAQRLENRKRAQRSISLSRYAAAAAILLLLGLLFWRQQTPTQPAFVHIQTHDFQADFVLPDGSRVWLNQHTSLKYAEAFDTREVWLEGEAQFEVRRDTSAPFRVYAGDVTTRVLGTKFNVWAYPEQGRTEVAVLRGKVRVETASEQVVLEAGEAAQYLKTTAKLQADENLYANTDAWKTGVLQFEDAPLEQVVHTLERLYGQVMVLDNEALNRCRFTARFERASIDEVLAVLRFGLNLETETRSDTLYLQGAGCQ